MEVLKITSEEFEKKVLKSEVPVLVDFYADWCGPCKMMSPVVEKLAESFESKIKVCKVNVDEETELSIKYGVSSIPTLIFIKDGQAVRNLVGMRDKNELEEFINSNI